MQPGHTRATGLLRPYCCSVWTLANAVLLGINPFDQFGVELGKEIARSLDDPEAREELDQSTRQLIEKAGL